MGASQDRVGALRREARHEGGHEICRRLCKKLPVCRRMISNVLETLLWLSHLVDREVHEYSSYPN